MLGYVSCPIHVTITGVPESLLHRGFTVHAWFTHHLDCVWLLLHSWQICKRSPLDSLPHKRRHRRSCYTWFPDNTWLYVAGAHSYSALSDMHELYLLQSHADYTPRYVPLCCFVGYSCCRFYLFGLEREANFKKGYKCSTWESNMVKSSQVRSSQLYLGRLALSAIGWYQKGPCVNYNYVIKIGKLKITLKLCTRILKNS